MVRRVREGKHGYVSETYEAYLVDFDEGVVGRFDAMSPHEQYSEAGIGFAWKTLAGVKMRVLVHADGQVVPLWPETKSAPALLFHPVRKQAWILTSENLPSSDAADPPELLSPRSVFVHWTDLRKPPPQGPKVTLPFAVAFAPNVINSEDRSVHGPNPKQPSDIPFVLYGSSHACDAVELDYHGGFACKADSYKTLEGGWSYWTEYEEHGDELRSKFLTQNKDTGETQGIDCKSGSSTSYYSVSPPRVFVYCTEGDTAFLWTPTQTYIVPQYPEDTGSRTSFDGRQVNYFERNAKTAGAANGWLDLRVPARINTPRPRRHEPAGYPYGGDWLFTWNPQQRKLHIASIDSGELRPLYSTWRCSTPYVIDWTQDDVLLGCRKHPGNPSGVAVLSPRSGTLSSSALADNRNSLLTATHLLSTMRGQREVVSWRRNKRG
jgi:hypothetical protein